jgi:phage repressor protein C with HTH and peptisase S24 domain
LEKLTEELVDWRLAAYSKTHRLVERNVGEFTFEAKVSHANGNPILFMPDKAKLPERPMGPVNVKLPDNSIWEFKFVKVACNVAKPLDGIKNELGELMRSWFGSNAGLPGTDFKVLFENKQGQWHARPATAIQVDARNRTEDSAPQLEKSFDIEDQVELSSQYKTHVPVYDLTAAAGGWGEEGVPEEAGWIRVDGRKVSRGMFAAQVVGHSMEPKIPSGSLCLFAPCPAGSRQNRLLLVQVNTHTDPEDGGRYTVKRYFSKKQMNDDGWHHETIELQPLNPEYKPIRIEPEEATDIRVIGEYVCVIELAK